MKKVKTFFGELKEKLGSMFASRVAKTIDKGLYLLFVAAVLVVGNIFWSDVSFVKEAVDFVLDELSISKEESNALRLDVEKLKEATDARFDKYDGKLLEKYKQVKEEVAIIISTNQEKKIVYACFDDKNYLLVVKTLDDTKTEIVNKCD